MSQGAIFKLVLQDERFDKFITASDYLRARFEKIRAARRAAGEPNPQPTFIDIERSHTLYIHAAYRPYVAVASEYARVKASGDGVASISASGGTLQFTFPTYGHFTSDMAIHVRFKPIGVPTATAATAATPYLRYCALPGVRMFKKIELRSDQVLIDEYTPDDVIARSKFFVNADQRTGWERCHGQQELREAIYEANGFTGSLMYRDGPQTPKLYHEGFDMIVPLQFWFCRDAAHALLNDLIPNSQRTITCELAPLKDIIKARVPAEPVVTNPPNPLPGTAVGDCCCGDDYDDEVDLPFSRLGIEVDLYVNGLYVNPEIHDIFASRVGFSLIRVHRSQVNHVQNAHDSFLLNNLKYPSEYLMVGVRARRLAADFDRWWLMGTPRDRTAPKTKLIVPGYVWHPNPLGVAATATPTPAYVLSPTEACETTTLDIGIDTIGVTAHGIDIYPQLPSIFYNAYMPNRYAENSMVISPTDSSAFLVNFCLYPGKFSPSGYYNLSAGREIYIKYALKPAVADNLLKVPQEMVISMSAINFLMRRGDKISLRYAL
jgi:hypothetical protein